MKKIITAQLYVGIESSPLSLGVGDAVIEPFTHESGVPFNSAGLFSVGHIIGFRNSSI